MAEIGVRGGLLNEKKVKYGGFSLGDLFYFGYPNPLTRSTLPFWDKAPLMVFTGYDPRHKLVQGINFHFIFPVTTRKKFFKLLMNYREKKSKAILNLAWSKRIKKMGLSAQDAKRVMAAYRNYSPPRIVNPNKVPFSQWPKAFAQVKPVYHGASLNTIRKFMLKASGRVPGDLIREYYKKHGIV